MESVIRKLGHWLKALCPLKGTDRVTLAVDHAFVQTLSDLSVPDGSPSPGDVVRRALVLYAAICAVRELDPDVDSLIFVDGNGAELGAIRLGPESIGGLSGRGPREEKRYRLTLAIPKKQGRVGLRRAARQEGVPRSEFVMRALAFYRRFLRACRGRPGAVRLYLASTQNGHRTEIVIGNQQLPA